MASILGPKADKVIGITVMGIGVSLMIGWLYYSANRLKQNTTTFKNTELRGQISYLQDVKGVVELQLLNQFKVYTFLPQLTDGVRFSDVAHKGDSIYKKRFGDTVLVYHDKQTYSFLFSQNMNDFILR